MLGSGLSCDSATPLPTLFISFLFLPPSSETLRQGRSELQAVSFRAALLWLLCCYSTSTQLYSVHFLPTQLRSSTSSTSFSSAQAEPQSSPCRALLQEVTMRIGRKRRSTSSTLSLVQCQFIQSNHSTINLTYSLPRLAKVVIPPKYEYTHPPALRLTANSLEE